MENITLTVLPQLSFLMLVALWVYFFIYSYYQKFVFPWGFSIVIIGILISGIGYRFYNNQVVVLSIDLSLTVSLIGMLWNVNSIRSQFYCRDMGEFLRFIGIGLIPGLLLGFFFVTPRGAEYVQIGSQYTTTALIIISIQASMSEEFLYRGYFLSYLMKYKFNHIFAIIFQALIFSLLHIPRYSGDWMALFIIFLSGTVTGYLTWKSNNLIPAFVLHIVVNLMAVIWWLAVA